MKKIIMPLVIVILILTLSACSNGTPLSTKAPDNTKRNDENHVKEMIPFAGNWKYEIYDATSDREEQSINRFFNMKLTKDGHIILTYDENDTLDSSFLDLSKAEKIKNNAVYTRAVYAIDLDEINMNDTYENNTYLFEDIHQSDGGWDWNYNLQYIVDEEDTNFFLANLVSVELDAYFSNDNQNAVYWENTLEDESIINAIARGSIEIEEKSNSHLKINYTVDSNEISNLHSLFNYIPEKELVLLTLSDKAMSVNMVRPSSIENISNVIKDGVNPKSIKKKMDTKVLNEDEIIEHFFGEWSNELDTLMHYGIVFRDTDTFDLYSPLEFIADLLIGHIEVVNNDTIQLFTSDLYSNVDTKVELSLNKDGSINYTEFSIDDSGNSTSSIREILFKQKEN